MPESTNHQTPVMSEKQAQFLTRMDAPAIPPLPEAVTADTLPESFRTPLVYYTAGDVEGARHKAAEAINTAEWVKLLDQLYRAQQQVQALREAIVRASAAMRGYQEGALSGSGCFIEFAEELESLAAHKAKEGKA